MYKKKNISSEMFQWPEPANCIFDKSNPVYYHYKKNKIKPSSIKIKIIENFFKKKYRSKYALYFLLEGQQLILF